MNLFSSNGTLLVLVRNADALTWAVLLVLLVMSVFCWTVFLYKLVLWHIKRRQVMQAVHEIKQVQTLDAVLQLTATYSHTLPGELLSKALAHLKTLLVARSGQQKLSDRELESLDHMVAQQATILAIEEESLVPYLSACAAIAPLMGLFGTVWGLINAFMGISHQHSADISAVAPGIAQALITTIAGLIVAIPALFFFYYLSIQLRRMEQQLMLIGDQFIWLVQALFYDDKQKGG
jgi:biopolymer transport protein ExbB/TolQ